MSYNKPEYIGIWLGLGKIGVVTALINTNLRSQSLTHCVNVAKCKGFIFTSEFAKDIKEINESLPSDMEHIVYGEQTILENNVLNMDDLLSSASSDPVKSEQPITPKDKLLYIYTSGTTGLPKAAIMVHEK